MDKYFATTKPRLTDEEGFPLKEPEAMKPPISVTEEHMKMPHEMYNWIVFKCFDACIGTFRDKRLISTEMACLTECVESLKSNPQSF